MRWERRLHRSVSLAVLPVALWAALPAFQWCRPGAGLRIDCLFDVCSANARPLSNAVPTAPSSTTCTASAGCATPSGRCGAMSCDGATCPMAAGSRATGRPSPAAPTPRGKFCVQGPNGGAGVRTQPPTLAHHLIWAQAVSAPVVPEPPVRRWRAHHEPRQRPPTDSHHPLPPARAPPASMGTA